MTAALLAGIRVVVGFALAVGLAAAIWARLPKELDVHTDIVGYPIHSNFNVNRYFWAYWLVVGFVPVATVAIVALLSRVTHRRTQVGRSPSPRVLAEPAAPRPVTPAIAGAVGMARVLFVGSIVGLEAAVIAPLESGRFVRVGLPIAVAYGVLVIAAAAGIGPLLSRCSSFWERVAGANALATPLAVVGLYGVSAVSTVTVEGGTVYEFPWFPAWLAVIATGSLLAWIALQLIRARSSAVRTVERRALLVIAAPVALFLFVASLPGGLGEIDMFHEGEALAAARLAEEGAFPWRDLLPAHGILQDVARPLAGLNALEDTRWGAFAGETLLLAPFYWLSLYFLSAYLFRRNSLFLIATQVAIVLGLIQGGAHVRFVLLPLVLLLLAALLAKPTKLRAAAFTVLLAIQATVTPEASFAVVAFLATVVVFEAYYYDRRHSLLANFRRTALCAVSGVVFLALWFAFLTTHDVHDDFLFSYLAFASDHQLTGGIPVTPVDNYFLFAAVAPVALVLAAFSYFVAHVRLRRPIAIEDWVMGALAVFVAVYYHKFLARADEHVYQAFAPAVPLLFYAVYRATTFLEAGLARLRSTVPIRLLPGRQTVTVAVLIAALVLAPVSLADAVRGIPARFSATAPVRAATPRVGFTLSQAVDHSLVRDLDRIFDAYVRPGETVFDFSNNPALFHYLLDRQPGSPYYHVSMAIRRQSQEELVRDLDRSRPKLVAFPGNPATGLPGWDGIPNTVRHYDVSEYLLDHYEPVLYSHGFVLMALKGSELPRPSALAPRLVEPPATEDLYFRTLPCDWGYAPNFLTTAPAESVRGRALRLSFDSFGSTVTMTGWAVDQAGKGPATDVVAAIDGRVVGRVVPGIDRPDVVANLADERFRYSGFELSAPIGGTTETNTRKLRVYALTKTGEATELTYGSGVGWTLGSDRTVQSLRLGNGRRARIVPGAGLGFVDSSGVAEQVLSVEVPERRSRQAYDWLEIETARQLHDNEFVFTDRLDSANRGIFFKTLPRSETSVRVQVGACPQWRGYESRLLYLQARRVENIRAIRLLP